MFRKPDKRETFLASDKREINPYMGFTSFQRFRGDPLYSDIIVRPDNKMLETEEVECYPVPESVPQKGDSQGFYPNTEVAYIRILWKEFEPRRKEYNYALIEDVLKKARDRGQTVMFRLLPHSTRQSDDVPDWLKSLIPCPERPDGMRVKASPKDPVYLQYLGEAIEQIALRFDDDPTLDVMDISLTGAWGEGEGWKNYPEDSLKELTDVYTKRFKKTQIIGQISPTWLVNYANETKACGYRADGLGERNHTLKNYPAAISEINADVWKKAPVAFESYFWLGEWYRKEWDIDEIIERTLGWHISYFNAKSLPIPWQWEDKIEYWLCKMGYHFTLRTFEYPSKANAGDELQFVLNIENRGVAPIYQKVPLHIRFYNEKGEYTVETQTDIRNWLPGENTERFPIVIPSDIPNGEYDIEMGIFSEDTPTIRLETRAETNGKYYKIGHITIGDRNI